MKKSILFSLTLTLLLTACSGKKTDKAKELWTTLPNGDYAATYLITAPDGRDYYVAFVDSVNYQQALDLQNDGWVLPRLYGAYAMDEHRHYTAAPSLEALVGLTSDELPDIDADSDNPDKVMLGLPCQLTTIWNERDIPGVVQIRDDGAKGISLWTGTRFPGKKGTRYNYTLNCFLEPDSAHGSFYTVSGYGISNYEELKTAMIMKRAELVDGNVGNNVYYVNDTRCIPSTQYIGSDGYEYYVVQLLDSAYTWYEALNMEHDGWLLPRTEGRYHGARGHEREVEYWRLHSEGLEPTVEGLSGRHPFVNVDRMSRLFTDAFPQPCWTGTPRNTQEAYMLGSVLHRWSGNLWEYDKNEKVGHVCLVKRISPDSVRYCPKGSTLTIQSMKVAGASGKMYHVVDPLGWHGFGCSVEEALSLEQPGWHIVTFDELGDMMGAMFNDSMLPLGYGIETDHPLFHTLFARNNTHNYFYARTSDGDIQTIYTRIYSSSFSRERVSDYFSSSSFVRLAYDGE